jgi:hypothetical protein
LEAPARKYTSPYRDVIRAKIVLLAAERLGNDVIAARLDTARQIVSKWRHRFFEERIPSLEEERRGGRAARFSPCVVVDVKRLTCELPSRSEVPRRALRFQNCGAKFSVSGIVAQISVDDALALVECRCAATVAAPQLDLSPRCAVCERAGRNPRSSREELGRNSGETRRIRDVGRQAT